MLKMNEIDTAWEIAKYEANRVRILQKAGAALFDGFTDVMTQEQIDSFERLYAEELKLFFPVEEELE